MPAKRREVKVAPKAVERLRKLGPSDDELEALFNVLRELGSNPRLGYPVAFSNPRIHRVDIGRFSAHYQFDEKRVEVNDFVVY
jgi:mRNA-degrading endonuclease RelE of RelBE toxin-antitoxin system